MPQSPYLFKRGSTFYFRVRIPQDLIDAEVYGAKTEIKGSLKTTDRNKALAIGADRVAEARAEFEAKREELRTGKASEHVRLSAKKRMEAYEARLRAEVAVTENARPLSKFSEAELWEVVVQELIAHERGAQAIRSLPLSVVKDPDSSIFFDASLSLALADGSSADYGQAPTDWAHETKRILAKGDIRVDDLEVFAALQEDLKAASIESFRRTIDYFDSGCMKQRSLNSRFKDVWADGTVTTSAKSDPKHTLGDLVDKYLGELEPSKLSHKTKCAYKFACKTALEFFGRDLDIEKLTREDGARFIDFLGRLPSNARKRYPDGTLTEVIRLQEKGQDSSLLAPKTQANIFNAFKGVLKYADEECRWIPRNPFRSKSLRNRLPEVEDRDKVQMTDDELLKVFTSPGLWAERSRMSDDGEPMQARFWVPWICLYHGLRANEVCQLAVPDFYEEQGVPCFHVRRSKVKGESRRTKNKQSIRIVPVHSKLVELGLLDYVAMRKSASEDAFLFPELPALKSGSRADKISKWFSRFKNEILNYMPENTGDKALHSFRHSFADALRRAEVPRDIGNALGGWKRSDENSGDGYGYGYTAKQLKAHIDKVEYPTLNEVGSSSIPLPPKPRTRN